MVRWKTISQHIPVASIDLPKAKLVFRDLGGEKSLRSIWDKYYNDVNAIGNKCTNQIGSYLSADQ